MKTQVGIANFESYVQLILDLLFTMILSSTFYCITVTILSSTCVVDSSSPEIELDVIEVPKTSNTPIVANGVQSRRSIFQTDLSSIINVPDCSPEVTQRQQSRRRRITNVFANIWGSLRSCTWVSQRDEQRQTYVDDGCDDAPPWCVSVIQFYGYANWVDSYSRPNAYIASTAPQDDVEGLRFWDMVWRNGVRVIAQLTASGYHQYWPTVTDTTIQYRSSYEITALEVTYYDGYVCTRLSLRYLKTPEAEPLEVTHCLFHEWPDMAVPLHTGHLLAFRQHVKDIAMAADEQSGSANASPILVHCIAGLGRTGTFIAIDVLIEKTENEFGMPHVDVAGVVHRLRIQRPNSILTGTQFNYCYTALRAHQDG